MSLMSARTLSSRMALSATRSFTCVRLCSRSAVTSVSSASAGLLLTGRSCAAAAPDPSTPAGNNYLDAAQTPKKCLE